MSLHGADSAPRFDLGRTLITSGARAELSDDEIDFALLRHQSGNWGDLGKSDASSNDAAVMRGGGRVLSVYYSKRRVRFYVITESDRSVTTILLPHEY